jgi:hypothetical protein
MAPHIARRHLLGMSGTALAFPGAAIPPVPSRVTDCSVDLVWMQARVRPEA